MGICGTKTASVTVAISDRGNFFEGLAAPKYQNVTSDGNPGSNLTHVDSDYVIFRLADAYLMYAEAHLRGGGGDAGTALGYVNALRERPCTKAAAACAPDAWMSRP